MKLAQMVSFALSLVLVACGVTPAQAPKRLLQPVALKAFPKENVRLVNNSFFMWKEKGQASDVSEAFKRSRELDKVAAELAPLNQKEVELDRKIAPLKSKLSSLRASLAPHNRLVQGVKDSNRKLADAKKALATVRGEDETKKANALIEKLEMARREAEGAELASRPERLKLEGQVAELNKALAPIKEALDAVKGQQAQKEQQREESLRAITSAVDLFKNQPSSVLFQFSGQGKLSVSISGWSPNDGADPVLLSTEPAEGKKANIQEATYNDAGGVVAFEVVIYADEAQTRVSETYQFKLARTNYSATDNKHYYSGDIVLRRQGAVARRGFAKLSN